MRVYLNELELRKRRRAFEECAPKWAHRNVSEPATVAEIVRLFLGEGEYRERFFVLLLDSRNRLIGVHLIGLGTDNGVEVSPKEVFRAAILACAPAVVLVHNHPSGGVTPSVADIALTDGMTAAGKIVDVKVLDHVIIGEEAYYSFMEGKSGTGL